MNVCKCDLCGKNIRDLTFDDNEKQEYSSLHYNADKNRFSVQIDMCQDCFDKMMEEYIKSRLKFENSIKYIYH